MDSLDVGLNAGVLVRSGGCVLGLGAPEFRWSLMIIVTECHWGMSFVTLGELVLRQLSSTCSSLVKGRHTPSTCSTSTTARTPSKSTARTEVLFLLSQWLKPVSTQWLSHWQKKCLNHQIFTRLNFFVVNVSQCQSILQPAGPLTFWWVAWKRCFLSMTMRKQVVPDFLSMTMWEQVLTDWLIEKMKDIL